MSAPDTEGDTPRKDQRLGEWQQLIANGEAAGRRLDQWLSGQLGDLASRNRIQSLIESGDVRLNGKAAQAKQKIASGDSIVWRMPDPEPPIPSGEPIPLEILYEDAELIVINKPAGLVVHPGAGNPAGTLVNALIYHCGPSLSGIGGVKRPGIVHRLDKDTTGVLVAAKTDRAHKALSAAFADHGRTGMLERTYHAIVWGVPPHMKGTIDAPLGRAPGGRIKRSVVSTERPDARRAVTHYRVIERFGAKNDGTAVASLVECRLETGRTHQIRVHMAHGGNPLIGDTAYGKSYNSKIATLPGDAAAMVRSFPRQALHAASLSFNHPVSGQLMHFAAPLPADMTRLEQVLQQL